LWIIYAVVFDAFKVVIGLAKKPAIDLFLYNVNPATSLTIASAVDIRYMECIRITSTVVIFNATRRPKTASISKNYVCCLDDLHLRTS